MMHAPTDGLSLELSEATGWDAIQESMLNHDGDKFGDFADDIDTLLVFVRDFPLNSVPIRLWSCNDISRRASSPRF